MTRPTVVSVGSINVDLVLVLDGPPKGTMVARRDVRLPGGKAANVAALVSRLGLRSRLVAQVGDDEAAGVALGNLRQLGVDVDQVRVVRGPTGSAVVLVEPDGGKTIVRRPAANLVDGDPVELAGPADVVVVDLEIARGCVDAAVALARRAGVAASTLAARGLGGQGALPDEPTLRDAMRGVVRRSV